MAKLPPSFSSQAVPIQSALSEGRTEDARRMVVDLLKAGKADRIVQGIAADLIRPPKRQRGRQRTLPQHWFDIGQDFHRLRESGRGYEDTLAELAAKFGFSESHIRNAVAEYDVAKEAHDEAART
ncbi:hypothetical protein HFO07_30475 [Rhizobium leguminosarum]|uniref:hypothetical protein n=1 Tax=Rhizobium leguminosarum TaxID=384 RepID=UPI001C987B12|nr:hypothetical protein [Rhizobium leguminosarum]MBY5760921.1 hypothetical protein [Rhizobium leguminosarum]